MKVKNSLAAPSRGFLKASLLCSFLLTALIGATAADSGGKLQVLVITGGHGFERKPFFQMFTNTQEMTFTHAEHAPASSSAYDRDDLLTYDVVVLYEMAKNITEPQKAKFGSLFDKGVGLVVLHHALASHQNWPEYGRLIGGHYLEPNPDKPGTVTEQAGYEHDVDIPVVVVARDHPITAGVKDFTLHDEIYWGFRMQPDVTPLLTTTHPRSGKPLAWARTERKSRVVFIQLGHGPQAFEDANYRRLLTQSIRWTMKGQRTP